MLNSINKNKIVVQLFEKLTAIRDALKAGGGYVRHEDLEKEIADREAYDAQQDQKIAALNGHYYPIEPYDFGKTLDAKTPDPSDVALLNTYAMTMEGASDPAQIIDGTVVKNLFDGVEFVWNAASQTWLDFGIGNIVTASNEHLGVVEGTPDPGDGSKDGFATVHPGGKMETIGFASLKTSVAGKVDTQQAAADAGKALLVGADGVLIPGNPAETDPNVPAWAKAATKPVYTPSEVGAEPAFAKNTAFNKNFGLASGTVLQGDGVSGFLPLPEAFLTYLAQYGFNTIPEEAQNMFDSLLSNRSYVYYKYENTSFPNQPGGTEYGVYMFHRRGNGELAVNVLTTPGPVNAHSNFIGAWEKPRPGAGPDLRRWNGWKQLVSNRDFIDSWVDIPLTLDKITELGTSWLRFNPASHLLSVRLEEAVINACTIGMRLALFNLPSTAVLSGQRRYRGMICISPPPTNYRGSSGLDIQIGWSNEGALYLYPMDDVIGANDAPLPHWDGSHLYGNILVSLISG